MNRNDELIAGAKALIDAGETAGLKLRLLGGLAVRLACASAARPPFERVYSDADCIVASDPDTVQTFIRGQGWIPEAEFNLYNGDKRLLFMSPRGIKLDIFLNVFSLCHDFDFSGRIPSQGYTVDPADLVLTKLQIHEVNDKDLQDAACVFLDFDVCGESSSCEAGIDAGYIAGLCSADWGLEHSLVCNLKKTASWTCRAGLGVVEATAVQDRITRLVNRIHRHEKTLAWRSRAILGTRLRWYQEVEEVER